MDLDRSRRQLLKTAAISAPLLAGCTSSDQVQDSDGDGVVDSEDYAPNDPNVQEKSDLKNAASASTPTPTQTPLPADKTTETATQTPTQTSTASVESTKTEEQSTSNNIEVDGSALSNSTYVKSYSGMHLEVAVRSHPTIELDRAKLLSISYIFPRGEAVAYGTSESFSTPKDSEEVHLSIDYTEGDLKTDERLHHLLFAMPEDETVENVSTSDLIHLYETDPFRITNNRIRRDEPDYFPGNDEQSDFSRENRPGSFSLEYSGETKGKPWTIDFIVWKSAYAESYNEPRGRSYDEYVSLASENGIAGELAEYLNEDAEANGFSGKREKAEVVIDFVQGLPYATDDVSRGYDDYPKMVEETIVDAGGDCEDTAILLCSILQAEPFGYDMVLIQPPEHMAAGVYGNDLPGVYWEYDGREYYYIETTGESWSIGDIPEKYKDSKARIYQV